MQYIFVLVALSSVVSSALGGGSCKTAGLCCSGRDSACVVQTAPVNAIVEDLNDDPCYCDHACLKLGDCCPDFREACGVTDCAVSEWGPWSECDAECGPGQQKREREVVREPQHGGKHCPSLSQYRGCQGTKCNKHVQKAALRETALILPEIYSAIRKINETHDIRNNLKLRYPKNQTHHADYCVEFEITKVSRACHKEKYYDAIKNGDRVCVRCENAAARRHLDWHCGGHGVFDRTTRFTALTNPDCHGKWVRQTTHASSVCSCPENSAAFIFV